MTLRQKYDEYILRVQRKHQYNMGSSRCVDSDKTKTYRAEWALRGQHPLPQLSKEDTIKFVDRVLKSKCWRDINVSGRAHIQIEWMKDMGWRTSTGGISYGSLIKLAPSPDKYTILHELVHSAGYMNHGLYFRLNLVKAHSRFLGRDVAKRLKKNFREQGLRMNKPRPALSYEQWLGKYEQYVA